MELSEKLNSEKGEESGVHCNLLLKANLFFVVQVRMFYLTNFTFG